MSLANGVSNNLNYFDVLDLLPRRGFAGSELTDSGTGPDSSFFIGGEHESGGHAAAEWLESKIATPPDIAMRYMLFLIGAPANGKSHIASQIRRGLHSYLMDSALGVVKNYHLPQNWPRVILIGIRDDVHWTPATDIAGGRLPNPSGFGSDLVDLLGDLSDPNFAKIKSSLVYPFPALNEAKQLLHTNIYRTNTRKGSRLSEMDYISHSSDVVREWTRLQMFPDYYESSRKRITEGRRRTGDPDLSDLSRDLPKYTQIRNAFPIELARQIGQHLPSIIG